MAVAYSISQLIGCVIGREQPHIDPHLIPFSTSFFFLRPTFSTCFTMNAFATFPAISLFNRHSLPVSQRLTNRNRCLQTHQPIKSALDALLFDCDGVLADTERDAHRVAFNIAFKERGLDVVWDEALYGKLLETGGGKERMTAYWNELGAWPNGIELDEDKMTLVKALHARKTELFMELVAAGNVPLREGVQRLVDEAQAAGVKVAVCSTSNEKAVQKIVDMLGDASSDIPVYAGDMVKKKKPSPDVYLLAAGELGVRPDNVCVVEDSFIGLKAATAAGMACVITKSTYTKLEDFTGAVKILNSLEDPFTTLEALTEMVESISVAKA